jgi:hypothetical protein
MSQTNLPVEARQCGALPDPASRAKSVPASQSGIPAAILAPRAVPTLIGIAKGHRATAPGMFVTQKCTTPSTTYESQVPPPSVDRQMIARRSHTGADLERSGTWSFWRKLSRNVVPTLSVRLRPQRCSSDTNFIKDCEANPAQRDLAAGTEAQAFHRSRARTDALPCCSGPAAG